MNTTDTRAAFEAWVKREYPNFLLDYAPLMGFYKGDDGERIGDMYDAWQAATEAAKATGTAGELPPLPEPLEIYWPELNSNALGCGVEDRGIRDRYDAAEYGWQDGVDKAIERVPEAIYDADQMRAYGQQCAEAARQPAPVLAVKRWEDRLSLCPSSKDLTDSMQAEIADLRAALAATAAPVLSDEQRKKLEYIANWMDSSVRIIQNAPDDYGPASQFDYDMGQAAHEILEILAATRSQP